MSMLGGIVRPTALATRRYTKVYTGAGSYTFNVPMGVGLVYVTACGGGGSAGVAGGAVSGGGGGGECWFRFPVPVRGGDAVAVVVGAGGAGQASGAANGFAGGSSSFGSSVTARGGAGGTGGGAGGASGGGTPGGTTTSASVTLQMPSEMAGLPGYAAGCGGNQSSAAAVTCGPYVGVTGGASGMGSGGGPGVTGGPTPPGYGGGGPAVPVGQAASAGAPGIVIVEWDA